MDIRQSWCAQGRLKTALRNFTGAVEERAVDARFALQVGDSDDNRCRIACPRDSRDSLPGRPPDVWRPRSIPFSRRKQSGIVVAQHDESVPDREYAALTRKHPRRMLGSNRRGVGGYRVPPYINSW